MHLLQCKTAWSLLRSYFYRDFFMDFRRFHLLFEPLPEKKCSSYFLATLLCHNGNKPEKLKTWSMISYFIIRWGAINFHIKLIRNDLYSINIYIWNSNTKRLKNNSGLKVKVDYVSNSINNFIKRSVVNWLLKFLNLKNVKL